MKRHFFAGYLACLLFGFLPAQAQRNTISMASELEKIADISGLPKYIDGMEAQFSSYDTTGNNDDGFNGKYSFIRRNPDSTLVIFEARGKGVINRIWTPTPNGTMLDFYFSGHTRPDFSISFSDLFSGKVFPFVAPLCGNQLGGYFCYFPIPYQNGCKIVYRGKRMQFYQIQYRTYPDSYTVENFNAQPGSEVRSVMDNIARQWTATTGLVSSFTGEKNNDIHTDTLIKPGQAITLARFNQGGRILGIQLQPADLFEGINKQVDLKITWDDEDTPAIYAPVADLFGYAFGKPAMQSLLIGTANNINYCYFPMPFDRSAKIELIYRRPPVSVKAGPVQVKADIYFSAEKRNKHTEGKFYASWNKDINPPEGRPHVYLQGEGKGHYVGTILQAQGLQPGMTIFFEGDDSTVIDGKMRLHGTGSEDYFNGGWYALMDRWDRRMSLPLHGALDYSLPFSRTGGYRLYLGDKLSFTKSIAHFMEHGPEGNKVPVDYTSVAFYYADAPLSRAVTPVNALSQVFVPDTFVLYPQLMSFTFSGAVTVNGNTFTAANGALMRIDLSGIPHGGYAVYADAEAGPKGAEVSFWQRQTQLSDWISFNAEQKASRKKLYLCDIQLNDSQNAITLHFKSGNNKNTVHLSRLILVKKR